MNSLNSVHLIGNIGQDPEIINFDNGHKLAKVSLATSRTYKNAQGEKIQDTDWHNVIFWNKAAELVEKYLKQGSKIAVVGEIKYSSYETKEGEKRYRTDIHGRNLVFLDKKDSSQSGPSDNPDTFVAEGDDDLPF